MCRWWELGGSVVVKCTDDQGLRVWRKMRGEVLLICQLAEYLLSFRACGRVEPVSACFSSAACRARANVERQLNFGQIARRPRPNKN